MIAGLVIILFLAGTIPAFGDSSQGPDDVREFLALFPKLTDSRIHVFSPPPDSRNMITRFSGVQIERRFYNFLVSEGTVNPFEQDPADHYFACFQVKLAGDKTGLIIRRPSQYVESAIDLYIWDLTLNKVSGIFNLTDAFGDEGWHFARDAWIEDLNGDQIPDIITRRKDFARNLDAPYRVSRSDSVKVYLGNGTTFITSEMPVNRSRYQMKYWVER
jgi:hypothetical protein